RMSFLLQCYTAPRELHSFPTRRSSDLTTACPRYPPNRSLRRARRSRTSSGDDPAGRPTWPWPLALHVAAASGPSRARRSRRAVRSEEHTSELQSRENLVCRLLLEKKNK